MKGILSGVGYAMACAAIGAGVDSFTKLSSKAPALGGTTSWTAVAWYAAILTGQGAVALTLGKKLVGKIK